MGSRQSGRRRSSGKKKSRQKDNSGLMMGLLIGGGGVAVLGIILIAFMLGKNSGNNGDDSSIAMTDSNDQELLKTDAATSSIETNPSDSHMQDMLVEEHAGIEESADVEEMVVETSADTTEPELTNTRPSQPYNLPDLIERTEKSVVRIMVKNEFGGGLGSGFVVDSSGVIVTNYHVIEGAKTAEVQFVDGRKASVIGVFKADYKLDLAILKINPPTGGLTAVPVAEGLPAKGISVATFGAPRGLSFSTSEGIVSGLREAADVGQAAGYYIQTTAAISGGNSGGPLVNMFGEVIGANTFKRTDGESLNFAISCIDIKKMVESRGDKYVALSPASVPVKISQGYGGAENLVGTERGRLLLSQIREAIIIMAPLNSDPTGRITNYVKRKAETTLEGRMKWKAIKSRSNVNQSTAFVLVAMYFSLTDGQEQNLVSDLTVHTVILARDVDKEGVEVTAIVWDNKKTIGKVTLSTLVRGLVSRYMETQVKNYFNDLSSEYRRAVREVNE